MPLEYFLSVQEQKCQEANFGALHSKLKESICTHLTYVELGSYLESLEPISF
jgi:hypothetical protein